jgi:hypothetical protein
MPSVADTVTTDAVDPEDAEGSQSNGPGRGTAGDLGWERDRVRLVHGMVAVHVSDLVFGRDLEVGRHERDDRDMLVARRVPEQPAP